MKDKQFVILGGGISGLSAAYYLKKKIESEGRQDHILLLEEASRVGGSVHSISEKGFIFDGGPRGFLAGGRRTLQLCKDLGIWDQLEVSSDASRIRYIWKEGRLHPLPKGPLDLFTSKVISWREIKTLLGEYFRRNNASSEDESVADFITRRFSKDILDNIVELLITGIYAGDPKRLSVRSIFPKLRDLEDQYGSIIKGFLKSKKQKSTESFDPEVMAINKRKLVSFKGGMGVLVDALYNDCHSFMECNAEVQSIRFQDNNRASISYEYDGSVKTIEADHIIFTTPAYVTSNWLKSLSSELSELLAGIEYAHIHVACLAYHKKVHGYRGFGFLSPRKEKLNILGCIWNEMIFPPFAPSGSVNLTAMYGGACHPEMQDWTADQLISETLEDLQTTMGISDPPDIVKTFFYDKGIPQYNIGHFDRINRIMEIVKKNPHVSLLGNYINGVGINDCVRNSYQFIEDLEI